MKKLSFFFKILPWNAAILAFSALAVKAWFDSRSGFFSALTATSQAAQEAIVHRAVPELPTFDWSIALAAGIVLGAILALALSGDFKPELGGQGGGIKGVFQTLFKNLLGGFLLVLGFQLAGGSLLETGAAAMNLSASAWLFLTTLAVTAVLLSVLFAEGGSKGADK